MQLTTTGDRFGNAPVNQALELKLMRPITWSGYEVCDRVHARRQRRLPLSRLHLGGLGEAGRASRCLVDGDCDRERGDRDQLRARPGAVGFAGSRIACRHLPVRGDRKWQGDSTPFLVLP